MTDIYPIEVTGWSSLLIILGVILVLAWRLIVYANSSADSNYVQKTLHEDEHKE